MTKLIWDAIGERYFEAGVDHGVLYVDTNGVAWNGLASVTETPSGGEATPYYLDGVKYLNEPKGENFGGTIEAYTYPESFEACDGSSEIGSGLVVDLQPRKQFGLSYRTRLGNDLLSDSLGYKIHIVYNALAAPTQKVHTSVGDSPDPMTLSWSFTTTPVKVSGSNLAPTAHVIIDSTKTSVTVMRFIEDYLYGSSTHGPRLVPLAQLFNWFKNPPVTLKIYPNVVSGLSDLTVENLGDLWGTRNTGLYTATPETRLIETSRPGLYTLES